MGTIADSTRQYTHVHSTCSKDEISDRENGLQLASNDTHKNTQKICPIYLIWKSDFWLCVHRTLRSSNAQFDNNNPIFGRKSTHKIAVNLHSLRFVINFQAILCVFFLLLFGNHKNIKRYHLQFELARLFSLWEWEWERQSLIILRWRLFGCIYFHEKIESKSANLIGHENNKSMLSRKAHFLDAKSNCIEKRKSVRERRRDKKIWTKNMQDTYKVGGSLRDEPNK